MSSPGYNVFIMPKHGGYTINELMQRHRDALSHIADNWGDRIGVFAEGLGGFAAFYLALDHGPMSSAVYQNAPGILTEHKFQETVMKGRGAAQRRKLMLPFAKFLSRALPQIRIPISMYLDFKELVDSKAGNRALETRLVIDGYRKDPDFDRSYPLSAVMSLVLTPPPKPLAALEIPTMLLVPARGWSDPAYVKDLYSRLPSIKKKLVEVDGSVFWMLSHPDEAANVICNWFDETV